MKTGVTSTLILLQWIYITLPSVIKAQEVKVWPEVTGYLGHDVTLHCQFIQGPQEANITQVQWSLLQPNDPNKVKNIIIVVGMGQGISIHEPYGEEKVGIEGLSLIIKDVKMTDAGSYSCSITTFPSGAFEETTKLIVEEQMPLSEAVVAAAVITVLLMLVIITATAYLLLVKRCDSSVNLDHIDTTGAVIDVARPSVIKREQDVVYSEVKTKTSRGETASSRYKGSKTEDNITYSEVRFLQQQL